MLKQSSKNINQIQSNWLLKIILNFADWTRVIIRKEAIIAEAIKNQSKITKCLKLIDKIDHWKFRIKKNGYTN